MTRLLRHVLVTGGGGFIGRHLARALAPSRRVTGLGRSGRPADWPANALWITHDLAARALPDFAPDIDAIVHLAQSSAFRDGLLGAVDMVEVNTESTLRLLDWSRRHGVAKFVFLSTGGIYGLSDAPLGEDHPYVGGGPLALYFATKYASELVVGAYAPAVPHAILRPFFVFGPGQNRAMLMPRLVERVSRGEPITLKGNDGMRFNPMDVSDCVRAIVAAFDLDGSHTINVAGPETVSLRRVGEIIGAAVGHAPVFTTEVADGAVDVMADTTRMRALLGAPATPLAAAIAGLVRSLPLEKQG